MIDVGKAISTARHYFDVVFFPQKLETSEQFRNIRLEEVVLSDDDKFWLVTLGFERSELGGTYWKRDYKIVKIDAETGQARGVQIREMA